jgi:hypothetical protein
LRCYAQRWVPFFFLSGWFTNNTADIVIGALLALGPIVVLLVVRKIAREQGRRAFQDVLQGFGADYATWYNGSGLAISTVRRQILVAGLVRHNTYAFEAFVGSYSKFTRDVPSGGDGVIAVLVTMLALMRITVGYFTDGLFVQFRDGSSWQIIGIRRKDAETWSDRLAATAPSIAPSR